MSALMYHLYVVMKEQSLNEITTDKIVVTSGKNILDSGALSDLLQKLESINITI